MDWGRIGKKLLGLAEFYYYWDADRQAGRGAGRQAGWVDGWGAVMMMMMV